MPSHHPATLILAIPLLLGAACAQEVATIYGTWRFDADASSDIAPWCDRTLHLEIRDLGDAVAIVHDWRRPGRDAWVDTLTVVPRRGPTTDIVGSPVWPANWYMGVLSLVGSERTASATWLEPDRRLSVEIEQVVEVSQGEATMTTTYEYAVERTGERLTLIETRSSRPTPVRLVFTRAAAGDDAGTEPAAP